jgi:hypothetical protein
MSVQKMYIGDSVYVSDDGYQLCLTTENGSGPSNTIFMEDQVFKSLLLYVGRQRGVKITIEKEVQDDQ